MLLFSDKVEKAGLSLIVVNWWDGLGKEIIHESKITLILEEYKEIYLYILS